MNSLKIMVCFFVLFGTISSMNLFDLQMLNRTNGAMCMDGSAPGIYMYQPDPNDTTPVNKLMIYFE